MRSLSPESEQLALAAVEKQPRDAAGYFWLAALLAEDDINTAIAQYEQGLDLAPENGTRWVELGKLRETAGDVDGAIVAYDQACFLVDRWKKGCPRAARLLMAQKKFEEAEKHWRMTIEQVPYWLPAKRGLVDALLATGRTEEAIPYLKILADEGDNEAREQLQEVMRDE